MIKRKEREVKICCQGTEGKRISPNLYRKEAKGIPEMVTFDLKA